MQALLGSEFPQFLDIYTQPAVSGLRINTLKVSVEEFIQFTPFPLEALPWTNDGFRLLPADPPFQPGKHPYHAAGLYYLQDPSAMAVVALLDPQPGEKVLDLSAAPGGKSTHIASRLGNRGLLVANEMHPRRAWDLAENLERWGARQAVILNEEPQRLADHFGAFFDRVLVDAPCSGEGMFRKSQPARSAWSPALVQSCALRQNQILAQAARLVRPGGILAYATCTFSPEENEAVIDRFLESRTAGSLPAFERLQLVRLWPHRGAPEGHCVVILKRIDDGPPAAFKPFQAKLPPAARETFQRFCAENLSAALAETLLPEIHLEGTYLYARPRLLPSLGSLRTIHPGWWVGALKAGRCEPAHALAMAISPEEAKRQVCLSLDGPALPAYLQGESMKISGDSGWALVAIEVDRLKKAFPLGWGKRTGDVLKNRYPHGLRWK
jgi:16S rRNA C967 or C1407 C5-methylase (RsmB/RsmF family)/NOL1/NOP2/fmu family ribosome biogenesis protein